MSVLAFARYAHRRDSNRVSTADDGRAHYIGVLAALVPAEPLLAHAAIVPVLAVGEGANTQDLGLLSFVVLAVIGPVIYVIARWKVWGRQDVWRALIPAAAFVAWTMIQPESLFDAVAPDMDLSSRYVFAVLGAVVLGVVAWALGYVTPSTDNPP